MSSFDLRASLPPVRDQGSRPTCVAFAMSDGHAAARRLGNPLSVDYLHFHANLRINRHVNEAASLASIRDALREDRQPKEEECPYDARRDVEWVPPRVGEVFGWLTALGLATPADSLDEALIGGRAAVILLSLSLSFYAPERSSHRVVEDNGAEVARHAVLVAGRRVDEGERLYLLRNSWGERWGEGGYAWAGHEYIDNHTVSVVSFEHEGEV